MVHLRSTCRLSLFQPESKSEPSVLPSAGDLPAGSGSYSWHASNLRHHSFLRLPSWLRAPPSVKWRLLVLTVQAVPKWSRGVQVVSRQVRAVQAVCNLVQGSKDPCLNVATWHDREAQLRANERFDDKNKWGVQAKPSQGGHLLISGCPSRQSGRSQGSCGDGLKSKAIRSLPCAWPGLSRLPRFRAWSICRIAMQPRYPDQPGRSAATGWLREGSEGQLIIPCRQLHFAACIRLFADVGSAGSGLWFKENLSRCRPLAKKLRSLASGFWKTCTFYHLVNDTDFHQLHSCIEALMICMA